MVIICLAGVSEFHEKRVKKNKNKNNCNIFYVGIQTHDSKEISMTYGTKVVST